MPSQIQVPQSLDALARHPNEGLEKFSKALASGALKPGIVLTQAELCETLGMSLSPLRETLVLLEEYGLVEVKPRSGILIIDPELSFIRESYQFRVLIETAALATFIDNTPAGWIESVSDAQSGMVERLQSEGVTPGLLEAFIAQDHFIHASIVSALNNKNISATHNRLLTNIRTVRALNPSGNTQAKLIAAAGEHLELLERIGARDVEGAGHSLRRHFESSTFRTLVSI